MIDTTKLRDGDMPLLGRIDAALRRVISGDGLMRIPAEATDPDIVLAECKREIERLRSENDSLRAAILNALPGVRYMDPPDGGGPSIAEQLLRMAEDAERYLWLRNGVLTDGEVNEELHVRVDSHAYPNKWALVGEERDAAILAVLDEVERECVPAPMPMPMEWISIGWNDCRAEVLRRLGEMKK